MGKKISVIIPIYNVEKYIEQCLISVLKQTYENLEIILVNDGTKDSSMKVIEKYLSDPRIKVINKENGGLSSARNAGLEIATGEYISFVDSDDLIEKNLYENLLKYLENEDIILFEYLPFQNEKLIEKDKRKKLKILENKKIIQSETLELFYRKISRSCWTKLYSHKFLKENNFKFIEGIIYEDMIWEIETVFKAQKIKYVPILGYYYREKRENSIINSPKGKSHYISCNKINIEIENFLKKNKVKISKGFEGSLILESLRMKYESLNLEYDLVEIEKIFKKYFYKRLSKHERILLLRDYILILNYYIGNKKNFYIKIKIIFLELVKKVFEIF